MDEQKLWEFVSEFAEALTEQLKEDDKRWGDTWLHRTRVGQEERMRQRMATRYDQYHYGNKPINWLQVAGDALICWLREQHPELSEAWTEGE